MIEGLNHDDFYVPSLARHRRIVQQYIVNVLLLVMLFAMVVIADAAILR